MKFLQRETTNILFFKEIFQIEKESFYFNLSARVSFKIFEILACNDLIVPILKIWLET